jgi:hypothetical protein
MVGTNFAVSTFRSHFGQTGKGTSHIFPSGPVVKNAVFKCIIFDPHLEHWRQVFADRISHRFCKSDWIFDWDIGKC